MSYRIKATLALVFVGLISLVTDISAQIYDGIEYPHTSRKNSGVMSVDRTTVDLMTNATPIEGDPHSGSNKWIAYSLDLFQVDKDGNRVSEKLNTEKNDKWKVNGEFVLDYQLMIASQQLRSTAILKKIILKPSVLPSEYFGKTLCLRVEYRKTLKIGSKPVTEYEIIQYDEYYFDVIGAPIVDDSTVGEVVNTPGGFALSVCVGDDLNLSIANDDYPFGVEKTYVATDLGRKEGGDAYKAEYSWKYTDLYGVDFGPISGKRLYKSSYFGPGDPSGILVATLTVTFKDAEDNVIYDSSNTPLENIYMCDYNVSYNSDIRLRLYDDEWEAKKDFNFCNSEAEGGVWINGAIQNYVDPYAEYEDDQYYDYEYTTWKLYITRPGSSEELLYEGGYDFDSYDEQYFEGFWIEGLEAINGQNTTYQFRVEIKDIGENGLGHCDPISETFTVTILEEDAKVSLSEIGDLCEGDGLKVTATVTGNSTYTYRWTLDGDEQSYTGLNLQLTDLAAGNHELIFEVMNAEGKCPVSKTVDFFVTEKPILTSLGDFNICEGESVEIGATSSQAGVIYTWTNVAEAEDVATGSEKITKKKVSPNKTTTYTVKATNAAGCVSDVVTITVTVNQKPNIKYAEAVPATVCEGEVTKFTADLDDKYVTTGRTLTYTWTWNDGTAHSEETSVGELPNITVAKTCNVTVTVTDDNACTSSDSKTFTVTMIEKPVINPSFDNDEVCGVKGTVVTLNMGAVVGSEYSYVITPISGAPAASESAGVYTVKLPADYTTAQTFQYTVKATSKTGGCESEVKTVSFKVNPVPVKPLVSVDPADGICEGSGDDFTVTVTNPQTGYFYQWFKNGVSEGAASAATSHTFSGVTATTNCSVKAIDKSAKTSCESEPTDFVLTVKPRPAKPVAQISKTQLCDNGLEQLTLSVATTEPGVTYTWFTAPLGATAGEGASINVSPTATTSYYVVASNGCPSEKSENVTVTVHKAPKLTASDDAVICEGESAEIQVTCDQANNLVDYVWSPAGGAASAIAAGGSKYTVTPVATTTYTVTATNKNTGCKAVETITVNVNTKPDLNVVADKPTVCVGESITLTASAAGYTPTTPSYTWTWNDGTAHTETNATGVLSVTPAKTCTVTVTLTEQTTSCVSASKTVALTVNTLPDFNPTASKSAVCDGESFTINMNPKSGATYTYSVESSIASFAGTLSGSVYTVNTKGFSTSKQTVVYTITALSASGCEATKEVTVAINPVPSEPLVNDPEPICKDSKQDITVSVVSPDASYKYYWYNAAGTRVDTNGAATQTFKNINATTTYTVKAVSGDCESQPTSFTITVNEYPAVPKATVTPDKQCSDAVAGVTLAIAGAAEPGVTYTWYNNATNAVVGTGASIVVNPTETTSYYVIASNGCQAPEPKSNVVTAAINPAPVLTPSAEVTICAGETAELSVTCDQPNTAIEYTWTPAGGVKSSIATGGSKYVVSPVADQIYTVVATNKNTGCEATESISVKVNAKPAITLTASEQSVCAGASVTVTASLDGYTPVGTLSYAWSWNNGASTETNSTGVLSLTDLQETTTVKVTLTDAGSDCVSAEKTITITVNQLPTIAPVATPAVVCDGGSFVINFNNNVGCTYEVTAPGDAQGAVVGNTYKVDLAVMGISESKTLNYTIIATDNKTGCVSETKQVSVLVNNIPVVPTANVSPAEICKDSNEDFVASVVDPKEGVEYVWFVGATEVARGTQHTFSGINETTNCKVVADNQGCQSDAYEFTLTVNEYPEVPEITVDNANYCENSTVKSVLSIVGGAKEGVTYTWYNNATDAVEGTGETLEVAPDVNTSYYVIATDATTNCQAPEPKSNVVTVTVYAQPTISGLTASSLKLCDNAESTLTVTADPNSIIEWYVIRDGEKQVLLSQTDATSYTYTAVAEADQRVETVYVTATNENDCTSDPLSVDLTIYRRLEYSYTSATGLHVCKGNVVDLYFDYDNEKLVFTLKEGDNVLMNNGHEISFVPVDGVAYTFTFVDPTSYCYVRETLPIVVSDKPEFGIVGTTELCRGSDLNLSVVLEGEGVNYDNYTFAWTKDGAPVSSEREFTLPYSETVAGEYTVTVADKRGINCENSKSQVVTVVELPDSTLTGTAPLCRDGEYIFAAVAGAANYAFYVNDELKQDGAESTYTSSIAEGLNDGDRVYVVVTSAAGCVNTSDIVVVAFPEALVANVSFADAKGYFCKDGEIEILVSTENGTASAVVFEKVSGEGDILSQSYDADTKTATLTLSASATIKAQVETADGCKAESNEITATMSDVVVTVELDNSTVCANTSVTATAVAEGGIADNYEYKFIFDGVEGEYQESNQITYNELTAGSHTIAVIVRDKDVDTECVVTSSEYTVEASELPVVTITSNMSAICADGDIMFEATADMESYEFFVDGVSQGVQVSNVIVLSGLTEGQEVSVVATKDNCASLPAVTTVARLAGFAPSLEPTEGFYFCPGETVTLTVKSAQAEHLIADVVLRSASDVAIEVVSVTPSDDKMSAEVVAILREPHQSVVDVYAEVVTENGCVGTTQSVNAQASSVIINGFAAPDLCLGATNEFVVTSEGAANALYQFIVNDAVVQDYSESNTYLFTATTLGDVHLVVNVKDASLGESSCVATEEKFFAVNPVPAMTDGQVVITEGTELAPNSYISCPESGVKFEITGIGENSLVLIVDGEEVASCDNKGVITRNDNYPEFLTAPLEGYFPTRKVGWNMSTDKSTLLIRLEHADGEHTVSFKLRDEATGCESVESVVTTIQGQDRIHLSVPEPFEIVDNNLLVLCEGTSTVLSAQQFGTTSFTFVMDDASEQNGTEVVVSAADVASDDYQYITITSDQTGCKYEFMIQTVEAPKPSIEIGNASVVDDMTYEVCTDNEVTLVAGGAIAYTLSVERDGVDVSDSFATSFEAAEVSEFTQTAVLTYNAETAGENDYSLYTFTYTYKVGACETAMTKQVKVYALPEATLGLLPTNPIISGSTVTATVTSATGVYFDFYANGVKVSEDGNTSNSFDYADITENTDVEVHVINAHGCEIVLTDRIRVLGKVDQVALVASSDAYCEGGDGVSIEVIGAQQGITYRLNECAECAELTATEDNEKLVWNNVANPEGVAVQTYTVTGYHAELPEAATTMTSTVTVTKIALPIVQTVQPYGTVQTSCESGDVLTLESSETDVRYLVYVDGTYVYEAIGTGAELPLVPTDMSGVYTVKAERLFNGQYLCPVEMNADYKVDVPAATVFELAQVNGFYCENAEGVEVSLTGSEEGIEYYLLLNGSAYEVDGEPLKVDGTGSAVSFGKFTAEGIYTVSAKSNGCKTMMSGEVSVTRVALPVDLAVEVTNYGHFCEGNEAGVDIIVKGQEVGKKYILKRNDVAIDTLDGVVEGFDLVFSNIALAGQYTVEVTDPRVDDGCALVLSTAITVVEDKLPTEVNIEFASDTICESEETQLIIYGTEEGVTYKVFVDGAEYMTIVAEGNVHRELVNKAGVYTIQAIKSITLDEGVYNVCPRDYEVSAELTVVARPGANGQPEVLYIYEASDEQIAEDACYGVDIAVVNAVRGNIYRLYLLDADMNPIGSPVRQFVAVEDGSSDIFRNIQNTYGYYRVSVSNGYCEDWLTPDLLVESDKYVKTQQVIAENSMCQGDQGVYVSLADAEAGVVYTLYDQNNNIISQKTTDVAGGFTFDNPIINEGKYVVRATKADGVGCEIDMVPVIDFKVYDLPISFELEGQSKICSGETGVQLRLAGSEKGVRYVLYSVSEVGLLTVVDFKEGTGEELTFKEVPAGTYIASARNLTTKCTSSMKGRIEVVNGELINQVDITDNFVACSGVSEYVFNSEAFTKDAIYYLMSGEESPEVGQPLATYIYDGVTPISYTFAEEGDYTLWASYDEFACLTPMIGAVHVEMVEYQSFRLTSNEEQNCGANSMELYLSGSEVGITYTLKKNGVDVAESDTIGTGEKITWKITGEGVEDFEVWASKDDMCPMMIDHMSVDFTTIVVPDARLELYIDGVAQPTDTIVEVCSNVPVSFLAKVNNLNVKDYIFKLNGEVVLTSQNPFFTPDITAMTGDLKYELSIETQNGCKFDSVSVVDIRIDTIPTFEIDSVITACGGVSDEFVLESEDYVEGLTYYLMNGNESPETNKPLAQVTYAGEPLKYSFTQVGEYKVWVSRDKYACLVQMPGQITVKNEDFAWFNLTSNESDNCEEGNMKLFLDGSEAGVTYYLLADGRKVAESDTIGTGEKITWAISGEGVVTFTVVARNDNGCEVSMNSLKVDFARVVVPQVTLDVYIEGMKQNVASGDTIEVCSNASVSFLSQVPNMNVTNYTYKLGDKVVHSGPNPFFIPYLEDKTGALHYTLSISNNNGCSFNEVDSVILKIAETQMSDNRLVAKGEPSYCAGENGVKLAFLNAEKGVIYRLYMQKEDGFDELMEIVELPSYYVGDVKDTIYFESWTNEPGVGLEYAKAGLYYVEMESLSDGCVYRSNVLEVIENPLPVKENTEVYFDVPTYDVNDVNLQHPIIDPETKSSDYGLMDAGYVVLEHASLGVRYDLFSIDSAMVIQTLYATVDDQTLFFGPIKHVEVEDKPVETPDVDQPSDSVIISPEDPAEPADSVEVQTLKSLKAAGDGVFGPEGAYTIIATDTTTTCSTEIGNIEFIEEELVAYNVYLFLNKNQTSIKRSLIPSYGSKGNHRYIDWSSKIDVVYTPKYAPTPEGTLLVTSDQYVDLYERNTGYTSIEKKSNIVFEILQATKPVMVNDTTQLDAWEAGCDSTLVGINERYYTVTTVVDTVYTNEDHTEFEIVEREGDKVYYDEKVDVENLQVERTEIYSYYMVGEHETQVPVDLFGDYGFYNFNDPDGDLQKAANKTGLFVYNKRPSFFGREEVRYRIYNSLLPNVRKSNDAIIQILCGNEEATDSSTVFLIPNAFSPNGDGYNDYFEVLLPYQFEEHSESSLEVYNRWGTLVYRSSGNQYGKDCPWWDGTSRTSNMLTLGEKLPSGTYFYVYKITFINAETRATKKLNGYIELRR